MDLDFIRSFDPKGIILSGGPNSVFEPGAPTVDPKILDLGPPVLGICYGMQLIAQLSGGKATPATEREYGRAEVSVKESKGLFAGFEPNACVIVWASHGDRLESPPPQFRVTATSANAPVAGMQHATKPIFGVLFHPEVAHTPRRGEREQVEHTFRAHLGMDLRVVDATHRFLKELKGIEDPEEKRRRIGHTFIDVFEDAARHVAGNVGFLVQGTLYPDVIESTSA